MANSETDERDLLEQLKEKDRRIEKLRERLRNRNRELAKLRRRAAGADPETASFDPAKIVWIFCTGRSGSTWLASLLGSFYNNAVWNEPLVGKLFGEFFYERAAHKRGQAAIMGLPYKGAWMRSVRTMVLDGAEARYPDLPGYLIIKEPHGSMGAPLLVEALPESRMVLLVRDPRDVVASALDGHAKGSWVWQAKKRRTEPRTESLADTAPDSFVENRARVYLRDLSLAKQAYHSHKGPKALVRYEDLLSETLKEMRRLCSELGIPAKDEELARAVEKHSWEAIPEAEKGAGKFYRKASPGGWREDLTEEQIATIEQVTAPLLDEFYPS